MGAEIEKGRGKTVFITEFLEDHPTANAKAVKEAWTDAGHDDTVSVTLVQKVRTALGLVGNIRRGRSAEGKGVAVANRSVPKRRGRKPGPSRPKGRPRLDRNGSQNAPTTSQATVRQTDSRARVIEEAEADIDRLIFRLMGVGGLEEVENTLRKVRRRLVVLSQSS